MARKLKTQPSTATAPAVPVREIAAMIETLAAARRGRKATAAPPPPGLPSAAGSGDLAPSNGGAGVRNADPTGTPRRRGPGRKPKPSAAAPPSRGDAGGRQQPKPRKAKVEAAADLLGDAPAAAPPTPPPQAASGGSAPVRRAAHWDRAADTVQFDWPEIERTAMADGPNQGMAKLLVAARAEGATSRWPL